MQFFARVRGNFLVTKLISDKMPELQAVVLAGGKGNRLELVGSEQFDVWDDWQRALMPLAGIPLFWYPLSVLARNNIKDVLLITNAACIEKINQLLRDGSLPELLGLNIEVVAPSVDDDEESDEFNEFGSAEILQMFSDRINRDFILLTGYFVSDILLHKMIEMHYKKNSVLTCLFSDKACNAAPPGPKNQQAYRDFTGICENTDQLLYLHSEEELEPSVSNIHVRNAIDFSKAGSVELTSSYVDCHVYLMDQRILSILNKVVSETEDFATEREFSSIKVDLIPYLLEKQYRDDREMQKHFDRAEPQDFIQEWKDMGSAELTSLFRIFAYKSSADVATVIGKCNTLGAYLDTNKSILEMKKPLLPIFAEQAKYPGNKVIIVKSQIDASSTLGESDISIVKSSIGQKCSVAKNSKVEESIVLDGATIDSSCQIKRCIVGRGAKIGEGCKLQNCVIEPGFVVNPKTTASDEYLESEKEWNMDRDE